MRTLPRYEGTTLIQQCSDCDWIGFLRAEVGQSSVSVLVGEDKAVKQRRGGAGLLD